MKTSQESTQSTCTMLLLCLLVGSMLCVSGCWHFMTQSIPYDASLYLVNPAAFQTTDEDLIVHMDESLLSLREEVKPLDVPLATGYEFQIGSSLSANLKNVLDGAFRKVTIRTDSLDTLRGKSKVLDVKLAASDFKIGVGFSAEHTAAIDLVYVLYEDDGSVIFALATQTTGSSRMSKDEKWGHVVGAAVVPGYGWSQPAVRGAIGRSFDQALGQSLGLLMDRIASLPEKS